MLYTIEHYESPMVNCGSTPQIKCRLLLFSYYSWCNTHQYNKTTSKIDIFSASMSDKNK